MRQKREVSGSERCANRVCRKRGVCSFFPCMCVQYRRPSGLRLCQPGLSESACVPFFLTVPASNHTLHACLFLSPSCLHAPPYVSSSLSVTFSGSPGQPVKCCNLSPSSSPRPPPPVPLLPSPAPPLVNHGANCRSRRRGGRGQLRKVKVEVGDKDGSH